MDKFQVSDIYDVKSRCYDDLPWVADENVFRLMFEGVDFSGLVDMGCGPATLGNFCNSHFAIPYIGIEKSEEMFERAKANTKSCIDVSLIKADFSVFRPQGDFSNYLLVLKNTLHLTPDYIKATKNIVSSFTGSNRLVVVETVSPSEESLEWIQGFYLRLGLDFKKNWFVKGELKKGFEEAGFCVVRNIYYSQFIDVEQWLASFDLTQEARSLAESYVEAAPEIVKREMSIGWNKKGKLVMLRLQNILELLSASPRTIRRVFDNAKVKAMRK